MTPEELQAKKAELLKETSDQVSHLRAGQMVEFNDKWMEQYARKFKKDKYPIEGVDQRNGLVWILDDEGNRYGVYPSWLK